MNDHLVRAISGQANVIGLACVSTSLVDRACELHEASPASGAALGRLLTGPLLMGALLKKGQRVGIKIDGGGPIGNMIAEADSFGSVCGFAANPAADAPLREGKLNVSGVVGRAGRLTVFKDTGSPEPYQGIVNLRTGEIAEDLAYYFAESEQIPTAIALGVFVEPQGVISAAGGFLIQSLPPSDENLIEKIISNIGALPTVTKGIRKGETPLEILSAIFAGIPFHVLETRDLAYSCKCSRERIEKVLISLGCGELEKLAREDNAIDIKCEFCRTDYVFKQQELEKIISEIKCSSGTL